MKRLKFYNPRDEIVTFYNENELQELFRKKIIQEETKFTWPHLNSRTGITYEEISTKNFFYKANQSIVSVKDESELQDLYEKKKISGETLIWGDNLPEEGIILSRINGFIFKFIPDIRSLLELRKDKFLTVFSGANNCGKTLLLKNIRRIIGKESFILLTNRFYYLDRLQFAPDQSTDESQRFQNSIQNIFNPLQNVESNDINLQEMISKLNDETRKIFLDLCSELFSEEFSITRSEPDNEFCQPFISVAGDTLSLTSTGTRLFLLLTASCFSKDIRYLLIDEPELGLNPELQTLLMKFLYNSENRIKYFPHLKNLFIVTHSHIFLDVNDISNNYIVSKNGNSVEVNKMSNYNDFYQLFFSLLGNSLNSFLLPDGYLLVEGKTDEKYFSKILSSIFPTKRIIIFCGNGDGRLNEIAFTLTKTFSDFQKSPYKNRIFIYLDQIHSSSIQKFEKMGISTDNIHVFTKNGIEFYYPEELMCRVFSCNPDDVQNMTIIKDIISINGIQKNKVQLSEEIISLMNNKTKYSQELIEKLINPIQSL